MKKARFCQKEEGFVRCLLCPRGCSVKDGAEGFCGVRGNRDGTLYALNYGVISSAALDPIEKKPLYRFHPGTYILSVGGYGCNMRCSFCQNHEISMNKGSGHKEDTHTPVSVADTAVRYAGLGNIGVAYTYNEPLINYEFVYDCAREVRGRGLLNVLVTNGFIGLEPLNELLPFIDAMNIDLKCFRPAGYERLGGDLNAVKAVIAAAAARTHVELTTLVVPGESDGLKDMEEESRWIASVNPEIPLHLSRFFPAYRMTDRRSTGIERLKELRLAALKHLTYVYLGNV